MALPIMPGVLMSALSTASAAFHALTRMVANRRILGQLGQMDDRLLRDVGLTRHDVWSVAAEPLFRDPTVRLAERARETRVATRAAARERQTLAKLHLLMGEETRAA